MSIISTTREHTLGTSRSLEGLPVAARESLVGATARKVRRKVEFHPYKILRVEIPEDAHPLSPVHFVDAVVPTKKPSSAIAEKESPQVHLSDEAQAHLETIQKTLGLLGNMRQFFENPDNKAVVQHLYGQDYLTVLETRLKQEIHAIQIEAPLETPLDQTARALQQCLAQYEPFYKEIKDGIKNFFAHRQDSQ